VHVTCDSQTTFKVKGKGQWAALVGWTGRPTWTSTRWRRVWCISCYHLQACAGTYCGGLPPTACVITPGRFLTCMVFLMTILTISCMSTYPLHACQWLSNVSTPVSCNVYWLQSRVCTPGVGLLVMMIWLERCTSCSSSCHHHLSHSNKVHNGDILVPADPGLPGKMAVETGTESIWLCGLSWVWVIIHCMCWLITCEIWFWRRFSWEWLIDQSPSD